MAQIIYDNPAFFEGYAQLPRSVQGLDGAPEWPALKAMLPDLTGKAVIDLGCGYGWFCRAARELGASEVTGVDISEKMLARAAELTADPQIHYQRSDLDALKLDESSLDLVYSSLALHYLPNWTRYSPGFSARSSPAAGWSFPWSTRFTPAPRVRAG